MRASPITPTIDLSAEGKAHGFLNLPYSHDSSAWGSVMIPITRVKNGDGPISLLTGGNHGDEYEGITGLLKLANQLSVEEVTGTVIIIPAMNYPAVTNGSRTSPIDRGNLNRSFPGSPDGTITEQIADYFNRYLVPMCDYALDIHSGGKTLDIIPFAAAHRLDNKEQEEKCIAGANLFGTPYTVIMLEMDATKLYDTAVESQNKVFVTTELGGTGSSTPETIQYADRGILNFLKFTGNISGEYDLPQKPKLLDMPDADCYIQSVHHGILEMHVCIGDEVVDNQLIASIHNIERTGEKPIDYYAKRSGIIAARRHLSLTQIGDTIAVIADIVSN